MERIILKQYNDVRDAIFQELYDIALNDQRVMVLSVDTGAMMFKEFKKNIPNQFYNVGIAEQNAMSAAAGLALTGRHVFVYGITNFVTLRCFEQLKLDICSMKLPVTILASGTGYIYSEDGPTHHMLENVSVVRTLPGMMILSPSDYTAAASFVHLAYKTQSPSCIIFDKGPFSPIYDTSSSDFSNGLSVLKEGKDLMIVATGVTVGQALTIADELRNEGIGAGVLDLYKLKSINKSLLFDSLKGCRRIATLEEHTVIGGLGGLICEFMAEAGLLIPVKVFGIPDTFRCEVGNRERLRSLDGINKSNILENIKNWIK